ncbi:MAG TPA: endolytic transglycosylase MltG [Patescibacteria group bacterium]|nr:endolytic transglycosylase MltG [Patescibacteria group bacterium]
MNLRKKRSKKLFLIIPIVGALFAFLLWWNVSLLPVDPQNKTERMFVVTKGAGVKQIAIDLKEKNLIKSPFLFYLLVKQLGIEKKIQAGDFIFSSSMSSEEIAKRLTHASLDVWVTIPEGKRAEEVTDILKGSIPTYDESWREELVNHEGYLFPDSYLIPKDASVDQIITQLRGNFDAKYSTIPSFNTNYTQEQIVTLASLIEREAITTEEKPIIASILYNRLAAGMSLQVDATIQYAKGKRLFSDQWWEPVTIAEYKSVSSPYNTYLHSGIPPGPIANPGLEALKAAANPADTEYVYYLHDKNRTIRYARTLEEHNENIRRFGL